MTGGSKLVRVSLDLTSRIRIPTLGAVFIFAKPVISLWQWRSEAKQELQDGYLCLWSCSLQPGQTCKQTLWRLWPQFLWGCMCPTDHVFSHIQSKKEACGSGDRAKWFILNPWPCISVENKEWVMRQWLLTNTCLKILLSLPLKYPVFILIKSC